MVFKLPSARCLSKSSREGHLSENMANPAMSTSVKGIAVSSLRSSGTLAKRRRTKPKSASAERCLRSLGAIKPISTPKITTSKRSIVSVRGRLSHGGLRKANCDIGVVTGVRGLPGIAVPPMRPSFTTAAQILWDVIPSHFQERVLHNVWCPHCGDMTTMTDFTGEVHGKSLVLRGTCITCRGKVARVLEGTPENIALK